VSVLLVAIGSASTACPSGVCNAALPYSAGLFALLGMLAATAWVALSLATTRSPVSAGVIVRRLGPLIVDRELGFAAGAGVNSFGRRVVDAIFFLGLDADVGRRLAGALRVAMILLETLVYPDRLTVV
jgi:hypothetical protein